MAIERKVVAENLKRALLKQYILGKIERAGYGGVDIQRTPLGTRITILTQRAGPVIGKKGEYIHEITDELTTGQWINILKDKRMQEYQKRTAKEMAELFKIENPLLEVQEVENPDVSAQIVAQRLAEALERGWHFRRAGHSTVENIMRTGVPGSQVIISGKLSGARSRSEKITAGRIQYCGEPAQQLIETGYAVARPKLGAIGVTVKIMRLGAKLPSDVDIPTEKAVERPAEQAKTESAVASAESASVAEEATERAPAQKQPETSQDRQQDRKQKEAKHEKKTVKADTKPAKEIEKESEPKHDSQKPVKEDNA